MEVYLFCPMFVEEIGHIIAFGQVNVINATENLFLGKLIADSVSVLDISIGDC